MKKSIIALLGLAAIGFSAECLAAETVYNIAHFMRENWNGNPANPIIDAYHEHEVEIFKLQNDSFLVNDPNTTAGSGLPHGIVENGLVKYAYYKIVLAQDATGGATPVVDLTPGSTSVKIDDFHEPLTADCLAVHPWNQPNENPCFAIGFKTLKGGTYRMRFKVKHLANKWSSNKPGTGSRILANNRTTQLTTRVLTTSDYNWQPTDGDGWATSANQVLQPGESLYFALDSNGNYDSDFTMVNLEVIATDESPSPSPVVNPVTLDLTKMADDYVAAHSSGFAASFDLGSRFNFHVGLESYPTLGTWAKPYDFSGINLFSNSNLPGWSNQTNDKSGAAANITGTAQSAGTRGCMPGEVVLHPGTSYASAIRFDVKEAIATANGDLELTFRDLNDYNGGCSQGVWVQTFLNGVSLDKRWCCNRATNDVAKIRLTSDLAAGDKLDVTVTKTDKVSCDATAIGLKLILPAGDKGILYIK